jgi:stage II sporulation protein D
MRPRLRAAAMTVLTIGLVAATPHLLPAGADDRAPAVARVAVDQSYPVPGSGRYTVKGHGYGHGHGMSQHGAQGAARQGLQHERILSFYYPGTTLGIAKKKIRVLVTADTTSDLVVGARSGLKLRDRGANADYALPRDLGATRWRVTVNGKNRNVVDYLADGRWRPFSPGGDRALNGEGEFRAADPVTLFLPSGERSYRGRLRAAVPSSGSTDRDTVNVVKLDDYVRGVVPAEMPALWEPEAVQAQSVAARTYAVWSRDQNAKRYYQICDTTSCQVYSGVGAEHPRANDAVKATARQILRYAGEPAFTQFSSSSGGWTSAGSMPYLVAKKDPYDDWSGNTHHDWSEPLTAASIERAYPSIGRLQAIRVTSRDGNGQWKGRVLSMTLDGARADVRISGDDFRWKFGLESNWFSF